MLIFKKNIAWTLQELAYFLPTWMSEMFLLVFILRQYKHEPNYYGISLKIN